MLFHSLNSYNAKKIVFCGVDELAEIAYITLQEFDIELVAIVDAEIGNKGFFNHTVRPLEDLKKIDYDRILITSFLRGQELYSCLIDSGIPAERILLRG